VVLFSDSFEQDLPLLVVPSGWANEPAGLLGLGGYTVAIDGTHVMKGPGGTTGFPSAVAGSTSWTNYTVSADVKVDPVNGHGRIIARHQSAGNFYACGLDRDASGQLFLGKEYGGAWTTFKTAAYAYTGSAWYHVDFSVQGNNLTCTVTEPGTGRSATITASVGYFAAGSIGATGEYGAEYDNFVVKSLP
jgi:hypothetical protein